MSAEVVMPRLGWSMEEGTLVEWRKADGSPVAAGEVICVIESDKAEQEVESFGRRHPPHPAGVAAGGHEGPGGHATTPADAKGLLKTAIRSDDPVVFMEHRALLQTKGPVPDGEHLVPFGRAAIARPGRDVTVVGIAVMVRRAVEAAEALATEGIEVEVVDPRTLAPLDVETILESVHRTGRLLIADETYEPCGIGAEIAAQVVARGFDDLDAPIRRLNGLHTPIPYSPPLEQAVVPDVAAVVRAVRDLVAE